MVRVPISYHMIQSSDYVTVSHCSFDIPHKLRSGCSEFLSPISGILHFGCPKLPETKISKMWWFSLIMYACSPNHLPQHSVSCNCPPKMVSYLPTELCLALMKPCLFGTPASWSLWLPRQFRLSTLSRPGGVPPKPAGLSEYVSIFPCYRSKL